MNKPLIKFLAAYFTLGAVKFLNASEAEVASGSKVTINVMVEIGTKPFTYQWKKNGSDILGATAESLILPAVTTADTARYSVVVSNSLGFSRSDDAIITVLPPPPPPPAVPSRGITGIVVEKPITPVP
jgi:hypothetical protein